MNHSWVFCGFRISAVVGAGSRNFMTYWSQLLYKEAQRGAAIEILNRVQVDGEAADRGLLGCAWREAARPTWAVTCVLPIRV